MYGEINTGNHMGELNVIATGKPYLSKILTTGSSEMLEKRGKTETKRVLSEVGYLLDIIEGAPDGYLGYTDIAGAVGVVLGELEDAGATLDTIGYELEKRDRIDG